jgi:hypothetical protein
MSDAQDDGVPLGERPDGGLGVLGPWRRLRGSNQRDRLVMVTAWLVGGVVAGLLFFLLSPIFGDDESVGSAVFFAAWITAVMVYVPELTHLWRKIDDGS